MQLHFFYSPGKIIRAGEDEGETKSTVIQSFVMVKREGTLVVEAFQNMLIETS